jgi:hypothetical protein
MQNGNAMQKKFKMHAMSLTPHAKYDIASMTDKQFERPWQPLKGKSHEKVGEMSVWGISLGPN